MKGSFQRSEISWIELRLISGCCRAFLPQKGGEGEYFAIIDSYPIDSVKVSWWLPGCKIGVLVRFLRAFLHIELGVRAGVMLPRYCGLSLGLWSALTIVRFWGVIASRAAAGFIWVYVVGLVGVGDSTKIWNLDIAFVLQGKPRDMNRALLLREEVSTLRSKS